MQNNTLKNKIKNIKNIRLNRIKTNYPICED